MKKGLLVLLAATLVLAPSCGKWGLSPDEPELITEPETEPSDLSKADPGLARAANSFGLDLFKRICAQRPEDNTAFSPLSLSLMLAMAAEGAEGDTYTQFSKVLGWGDKTKEELGEFYQTMINGLVAADPEVSFTSANSFWMAAGFPFETDYQSLLTRFFHADTFTEDFSLPATVKKLNDWCSEKTAGKIPVLCDKLPPECVMILVNALLFKAPWTFKWEVQKGRDFRTAGGAVVKKDYLCTETEFSYSEWENYEVVGVPYGNGSFRLEVLLPKEGKTLAQVVAGLDDVRKTYAGGQGKGKLYLPMFSIEDESNDLIGQLADLGLTLPFTSGANFYGISKEPLYISKIVQKVKLDVTEKGTEFAAVTGGFVAVSLPKSVSVDLNRPFLFQIRELTTGSVLLLGTLSK